MPFYNRQYRPGQPLPPLSGDAEFQFTRIGRRIGKPMLEVARYIYDLESQPGFKAKLPALDNLEPDPNNCPEPPYPIAFFYDNPIPRTLRIPPKLAAILIKNSLALAWLHMRYVRDRARLEHKDGSLKSSKELAIEQEKLVQRPPIQWRLFEFDEDEPDLSPRQWMTWFDMLQRGVVDRLPTEVQPLPAAALSARPLHPTSTSMATCVPPTGRHGNHHKL